MFSPAEESAFMLFSASKSDQSMESCLSKYLQVTMAIGTGGYIFSNTCGTSFILLVFGEKWVSDSCADLLQTKCLYTVFMALNGIAEAYAFAKASESTLKKLRRFMYLNSIIYIGVSYILVQRFGVVGLIYASCLTKLFRALSSLSLTLS